LISIAEFKSYLNGLNRNRKLKNKNIFKGEIMGKPKDTKKEVKKKPLKTLKEKRKEKKTKAK
jgi:hypothetical protein